jgi:hypothetical protein
VTTDRLAPEARGWLLGGNAWTDAANYLGTIDPRPLRLGTSGVERVRLDAAGRLGIGTTTPGFPLSFPDTLGDKISLWGQTGDHFGFGIAPATLRIYSNSAASNIAFGYGNSVAFTETVRFGGNGRVGIGTTSPLKPLQIGGGAAGSEGMIRLHTRANEGVAERTWEIGVPRAGAAAAGQDYSFVIDDTGLGTDPEVVVRFGTGNVGIGTMNPTGKLDVRGNIKMGDTGSLFATGASENLRIIRGSVWEDGSKLEGSGFTSIRTETGRYRILFDQAFSSWPTAVVSSIGFTTFQGTASSQAPDSQSFWVYTRMNGAVADARFSFIVIGPR